ncbi:formimidoylglutamase [Legionella jordanis]|uniref:Formimidoylglutamase n=1 Tax=Legionella jordanis TaxID=456 RepID=A0A0W0V9P4_9GAMM|nr:formimidoylglutamase [Legionella jordanis]KTD16582.1 formiminoglutamase [Legionella jordanis]RMX03878.1 formimidoylglutamase [Legionella jordanis]VEH11954.1 formimidoylglutamase [Legionella jordanis]HAT8712742.1 formimidoylglutamase [Legionella jordanis]
MLKDVQGYLPPDASLWRGRKDSLPGERFFQRVNLINLQSQSLATNQQGIAFLGFCSDEGIRRNEGRPGAKEGPMSIREQLAKLPCHKSKNLIDIGNIVCQGEELELAQSEFAQLIQYAKSSGYKTIAFGGGHEIAWAHYLGLTANYPKLAIINFDAHFDLRPLKDNQATSGTPFLQIAQYCRQNQLPFNYCCLGIQPVGNTESLFKIADELDVTYLTAEQINTKSLAWQIAFLDDFLLSHDYIYLTICMDVFAECFAPAVSAPQALGMTPWQALTLLKYILQTGKVVSFDVAELSPPLDQNHKTARLAANLVAELLDYY